MKVKMKAAELVDVDLQLVSMVKNGAIREPFKIVKQEETLEDKFHKVFSKEAKPHLTCVIVKKDKAKEVAMKMVDAGIVPDMTETTLKEGSVLFKLEGYKDEDTTVLMKSNEDVYMGFSRISKEYAPYSLENFEDKLEMVSIMPSIDGATYCLSNEIVNCIYGADSKTEAKKKMVEKMDVFKKFVSKLLDQMPESVYKLEQELQK